MTEQTSVVFLALGDKWAARDFVPTWRFPFDSIDKRSLGELAALGYIERVAIGGSSPWRFTELGKHQALAARDAQMT